VIFWGETLGNHLGKVKSELKKTISSINIERVSNNSFNCIGGVSKIINILSNPKFDGEGHGSAFMHLKIFDITRRNLKIVKDNEICQLFILTFKGRIKSWFWTFPAKSSIVGNN
jgi:hypothetical protein